MFVGSGQYLKHVEKLTKGEGPLSVAVAFWGEGAEALLNAAVATPLRVICNLRSGGTNPAVIAKMVSLRESRPDIQIQQCDRLHAKVMIGRETALIGSANLSINGLGFEGAELAHWLEAGIETNEPSEVSAAQEWFNQLWSSTSTRAISKQDLIDAAAAYAKNRRSRADNSRSGPFTFDNYTIDDLRDRDAYALLYRSRPGDEALERAAQHKAEQQARVEDLAGEGEGLERWEFETWSETLDVSDRNEYLCLYWTPRGALRVDGVCRMVSEKLRFTYKEDGTPGWVDLAKPADTLLGRRLIQADCARMANQLKPHIAAIWDAAEALDEESRRIHLSKLKAVIDGRSSESRA